MPQSRNQFQTFPGGYANPDEGRLNDSSRPRDPHGFRLGGNGDDDVLGKKKNKQYYFKAKRSINISGSNTSYQDIPFDKTKADDIDLEIEQYGDIAEINEDGYIKIKHKGLYLINAVAQNIDKDGERTTANLFSGPIGWYIRKEEEKTEWSNNPHMMLVGTSITYIVNLESLDVIVPKVGGTVNGTVWYAITKLA